MLCALQDERLWAVDFAFASCLKRSEPDCLDQESPPLGIGCLEKCTNYLLQAFAEKFSLSRSSFRGGLGFNLLPVPRGSPMA